MPPVLRPFAYLALWLAAFATFARAQAQLPDLSGLVGADIDESAIANTYFVRQTGGSNANDGKSFATAHRTVHFAVQAALNDVRAGIPTRVLIYDGTYREALGTLDFGSGPGRTTLLVIEGAPGQNNVVLSGSDILDDGWEPYGADGILQRPSPLSWGTSYVDRPQALDVARRRELLFVDGRLLHPRVIRGSDGVRVDPADALTPGSFGFDQNNAFRKIYAWPAPGTDWATATKEVAVRDQAMRLTRKENFVLRNLTLQHYAGWYFHPWGHRPVIELGNDSRNLLFEDVTVRWCSGTALRLPARAHAVTLRRVHLHYNGHTGLSADWDTSDIVIEDSSFNHNGWRAWLGGDTNWWTGGVKIGARMDRVAIRRCQFVGNMTNGLWFDVHARNTEIREVVAALNHHDGLFLEISNGPFLVERSLFAANGRHAAQLYTVGHATLRHNIFHGGRAGFEPLRYRFLTRAGDPHWELEPFGPGGIRADDNVVVGRAVSTYTVAFENNHTVTPGFWSVYRAAGNSYHHVSGASPHRFRFGPWGQDTGNFAAWDAYFGWRETGSAWRDPRFVDPEGLDFRFAANSPLVGAAAAYLAARLPLQLLDETLALFEWAGHTTHVLPTAPHTPPPAAYGPPAPAAPSIATLHVAPAPLGSDTTGNGSAAAPFATPMRAYAVAQPGDVIHLAGGVYPLVEYFRLDRHGTAAAPITVMSAPGQWAVLDFAPATGNQRVWVEGNYNVLRDLEIRNSRQQGIWITQGASHNDFINLVVRDPNGSAVQIWRGSHNRFFECLALFTRTVAVPGDADGFGSIGRGGPSEHNRFYRCIAVNAPDDGFDTWEGRHTEIRGCWSLRAGFYGGDGNGFKLGPGPGAPNSIWSTPPPYLEKGQAAGTVARNVAIGSTAFGFDTNGGAANTIDHNTALDNGSGGFAVHTYSNLSFRQNTLRNNVTSNPNPAWNSRMTELANSWNLNLAVTAADFHSVLAPPVEAFEGLTGSEAWRMLYRGAYAHLARPVETSPLVYAGADLGEPFDGPAPTLGAYPHSPYAALRADFAAWLAGHGIPLHAEPEFPILPGAAPLLLAYAFDVDPFGPAPRVAEVAWAADPPALRLHYSPARAGLVYEVEHSPDLSAGSWSTLGVTQGPQLPAVGGFAELVFGESVPERAFLRLRVRLPIGGDGDG